MSSHERPPPDEGSLERPGVSVVIPVFNGAATIQAALTSLLTQQGVDLELVIVNDGSVDATPTILMEFEDHPRVRLLRHATNRGLVASLNEGIEAASHPLIARLDADDVAMPGRLALQAHAFAGNPSLVLHATSYQRILPDATVVRTVQAPLTHGSLLMSTWGGNRLCHSAVMFRRAEVLALGGYRADYFPVEDFDLWVRLLGAGLYAGSEFVGTRYLVNPDGISQHNQARQRSLQSQITGELLESLGEVPAPDPRSSPTVLLRHLARCRHAVRQSLRDRGIAATGVDAYAYRLAMDCTVGRPRVVRHLLAVTQAPTIWFASHRGRSQRSSPSG